LKGAQALVSIAARLCLTEAALELDDLLVARIRLYGDRTALLRRLTELTRVASRWRRQLVRCEEQIPSRRSSAEMPPVARAAVSASRRILTFSAVENRRRVAFADTSVDFTIRFIIVHSSVALDTDLWGGRCLSYVGREGGCSASHRSTLLRSAILSRWATLHTSASGYFARSTEQMAAWRRSMRYLPHGVDVVPAACGLHVSTSVVKVSNNLNPADPATISDVSES